MPKSRAIVWIESRRAAVFRFGADPPESNGLAADAPQLEVPHKAGALGAGRPAADFDLFDRVIDALRGIQAWRLIGPDRAKDELVAYLDKYKERDGHVARLRARIVAVSPASSLSDETLLDHARQTLPA